LDYGKLKTVVMKYVEEKMLGKLVDHKLPEDVIDAEKGTLALTSATRQVWRYYGYITKDHDMRMLVKLL